LPPVPVVKVEPPKIKMPDIKVLKPPKLPEIKMAAPAPVVSACAPEAGHRAAAPKVVSLAHAQPAAVVNNSPHPALLLWDRPITDRSVKPSCDGSYQPRQRGLAGMPASNSGAGPAATSVNLGSGSPTSQNMAGNGAPRFRV